MTLEDLAPIVETLADRQARSASLMKAPVGAVIAMKSNHTTAHVATVYDPVVCLIVQGSKETRIGDRTVNVDAGEAVIVSHDLPVETKILTASESAPYLAAIVPLDYQLIRDLDHQLNESEFAYSGSSSFEKSVAQPGLIDAIGRYFKLTADEMDEEILGPLVLKEIHYHLLTATNGGMLRRLVSPSSRESQIAKAISHIRANFREPLAIESLANISGMSVSSFHAHFKAVTETTPLQYQKELRLIEANRSLGIGGKSVSEICFAVGYESVSQFSREYGRKYGNPPSQDLKRT